MAKKLKQAVRVSNHDSIELDYMTLDKAIAYLRSLKKEHGKLQNLKISSEPKFWDDGYELALVHDRLETTKKNRNEKHKKRRAKNGVEINWKP